jgi:hypothetical protein
MPTEFGTVSFNFTTSLNGVSTGRITFTSPPFGEMNGDSRGLRLIIRLRALSSSQILVNASIGSISPSGANVTLLQMNSTEESITVEIGATTKMVSLITTAMFE